MSKFVDALGKEHTLRLEYEVLKKAKAAGIELGNAKEFLASCFADKLQLIEIVRFAGNIAPNDLAGLRGDCLDEAYAALVEAVCDFFPLSAKVEMFPVLENIDQRQSMISTFADVNSLDQSESNLGDLHSPNLSQPVGDDGITQRESVGLSTTPTASTLNTA